MVIGGTILVSGANGFLGVAVCNALVARGFKVRGMVRDSATAAPRGVEEARLADLEDLPRLVDALKGVEAVVHLAARVEGMGDRPADPIVAYRRTNVQGTRVLVEAACKAGVETLVFISSVKAVGDETSKPWSAGTRPAPTDPYGVSKFEAEGVVREVADSAGVRAPVLRLPLVYGPGMRAHMLRLFALVDQGWPVPMGSGVNRRSLAFVGNVTAAIETALTVPAVGGGPWFVSDGHDLTMEELVRAIAAELKRPARILHLPDVLLRAAGRVGDAIARAVPMPFNTAAVRRLTGSLVIDSGAFVAASGVRPPFTVQEGLHLTAQWFKSRGGALA